MVCMDHFLLEERMMFHAMDAATRFFSSQLRDEKISALYIIGPDTIYIAPDWLREYEKTEQDVKRK